MMSVKELCHVVEEHAGEYVHSVAHGNREVLGDRGDEFARESFQACSDAPTDARQFNGWLQGNIVFEHPIFDVKVEDREYSPEEALRLLNGIVENVGVEQTHASTEDEAKEEFVRTLTRGVEQVPIFFDEMPMLDELSDSVTPKPLLYRGDKVVGLDLEYDKGQLTMVQLCGENSCVIYRRPVEESAIEILRDPSVIKVINLSDQDKKVLAREGITVNSVVDLNEFRQMNGVCPFSIHKFAKHVCGDNYIDRATSFMGVVKDEYARKDAYYTLLLYIYTCSGAKKVYNDSHHYRLVGGSYKDVSEGRSPHTIFKSIGVLDPCLNQMENRRIVKWAYEITGERDLSQYLPHIAWLQDYFPDKVSLYLRDHGIPESEEIRYLARAWIRAKIHDPRSSFTPEIVMRMQMLHQRGRMMDLKPVCIKYDDVTSRYGGDSVRVMFLKACCACGGPCERVEQTVVYTGHRALRDKFPMYRSSIREGPDILIMGGAGPLFVYFIDSLQVCQHKGPPDKLEYGITQAYLFGLRFGYTMCYEEYRGEIRDLDPASDMHKCSNCPVCNLRRYFLSRDNAFVKARDLRFELQIATKKDANRVLHNITYPDSGVMVFERDKTNAMWRVRNPRYPCSCGCTMCRKK